MMRSLFALPVLSALLFGCQPSDEPGVTVLVDPPAPEERTGSAIVEEVEEVPPSDPGVQMVDVAPVAALGDKFSETYDPGDQPSRSVGAYDAAGQPMSRCWAGFTGGHGPEGESSRLEVILHPNALDVARPPEPLGRALVRWVLETNREDWTEAQIDFQWLGTESPLLLPETLMLYRAESADGPWEPVGDQRVNSESHRVSATVGALGHFMIFGERDPEAPTTRNVVDVLLGKVEPEPRLDVDASGTVDALDVSISTMVGGGDLSEYEGL